MENVTFSALYKLNMAWSASTVLLIWETQKSNPVSMTARTADAIYGSRAVAGFVGTSVVLKEV